ncbi:MAG TPA: hypothetical protein GXZ27_09180 [Thermoanaerobacterales bacterium]|nr:hypothetical protein [Thermoanaerobacterales bacterium]
MGNVSEDALGNQTIPVVEPGIDEGWDTLVSPYAKAHCDVDMFTDLDVTIEGNIKFKEERWQQSNSATEVKPSPVALIYLG